MAALAVQGYHVVLSFSYTPRGVHSLPTCYMLHATWEGGLTELTNLLVPTIEAEYPGTIKTPCVENLTTRLAQVLLRTSGW